MMVDDALLFDGRCSPFPASGQLLSVSRGLCDHSAEPRGALGPVNEVPSAHCIVTNAASDMLGTLKSSRPALLSLSSHLATTQQPLHPAVPFSLFSLVHAIRIGHALRSAQLAIDGPSKRHSRPQLLGLAFICMARRL